MTDFEKRAQKLLDNIASRKNAKLADQIFREPKQREAKKVAQEKEEAERLKQIEGRWNPWLEKAMQREKQEMEEHNKLLSRLK